MFGKSILLQADLKCFFSCIIYILVLYYCIYMAILRLIPIYEKGGYMFAYFLCKGKMCCLKTKQDLWKHLWSPSYQGKFEGDMRSLSLLVLSWRNFMMSA